LKGAIQWTQAVSQLCDEQLKRERQSTRGRRQKKLLDYTAAGAYADAETELKDLRVELACFQSKTCCFLPAVVDTNVREQTKYDQSGIRESPYRLLLNECSANLKLHPASSSLKETATQVILLLCTDVVLIARPHQTGGDDGVTSYTILACAPVTFLGTQQPTTGPACSSQYASLDTSSENSISLSQHSALPQTPQGDSAIGTSVSPQTAFLSSSSGVSTASNEDLAERQSEDGVFTGSDSCYSAQQPQQLPTEVLAEQVCKTLDSEGGPTDNVLSLYWPPSHRYYLQLPDFRSWIHCRSQLQW
uniref:AF4/FMR2 family, member 2 n=1 Tax=Schistocephalus solidus TaxID=70667 RepID=A0A183T7V6_SCHSO